MMGSLRWVVALVSMTLLLFSPTHVFSTALFLGAPMVFHTAVVKAVSL